MDIPPWIEHRFASARLTPRTHRKYCDSVLYWELWHRLRFGSSSPIADEVPRSVSPEAMEQFVDDHCALAVNGRLRMRMPEAVDQGLRERGFNRRTTCISPRTLHVRLVALSRFHALCGLFFDQRSAFRRMQEVGSLWELERALVGTPSAVPMTYSAAFVALMGICGEDEEGRRDAALILMATRMSANQIRAARCGDVRTVSEDNHGVSRIISTVTIRHPQGRLQSSQILYGDEGAQILKAWVDLRRADGATDEEPLFPSRGTRPSRGSSPVAASVNWMQARFRHLGQRAGVGEINGRSATTMLALRKAFELENWEHFPLVKVARNASMSVETAFGYKRRRTRASEDRDGE